MDGDGWGARGAERSREDVAVDGTGGGSGWGPADVLRAQLKQGCAWVKFGGSARIEEAQVADFYFSLVAKNAELQLVHKRGPHVLAAAAAYAKGQRAGIGGVDATERWNLPSVYFLVLHCYSSRRVAGLVCDVLQAMPALSCIVRLFCRYPM